MNQAIPVVAAAILDDSGGLLAGRRSAPEHLAGRWEFPGGKVESGETALQALDREVREELGVSVSVLAALPGKWPLGRNYELQVFICRIESGTPEPLEDHDEVRWLAAGAWREVDWLDADAPVLDALEEWWRRHKGQNQPSAE